MIFLKLLALFFLIILLWHFLTRKFVNSFKLNFVFGKKGSGKSTYLCRKALEYSSKGFLIYTNMDDLCIPDCRHINIEDLGEFVPEANSCLILDEVGMYYDNRNFKNFKPETRDFWKYQRHYRVVAFLASQTFDVDKKIRDLADSMVLQTNFLRIFTLSRPIDRIQTLTEPNGEEESKLVEALKWAPFWTWQLTFIPRYTKYFDSYHTPEKPFIKYSVSSFESVYFKEQVKTKFFGLFGRRK